MTTTRRRRGTGHELREVVIAVATDLLAELGDVEALTMRAVATAAGVTPPSVYRHFPDKQTSSARSSPVSSTSSPATSRPRPRRPETSRWPGWRR